MRDLVDNQIQFLLSHFWDMLENISALEKSNYLK